MRAEGRRAGGQRATVGRPCGTFPSGVRAAREQAGGRAAGGRAARERAGGRRAGWWHARRGLRPGGAECRAARELVGLAAQEVGLAGADWG